MIYFEPYLFEDFNQFWYRKKQAEAEVVPSSSQVKLKLKLGKVKLSWVKLFYVKLI